MTDEALRALEREVEAGGAPGARVRLASALARSRTDHAVRLDDRGGVAWSADRGTWSSFALDGAPGPELGAAGARLLAVAPGTAFVTDEARSDLLAVDRSTGEARPLIVDRDQPISILSDGISIEGAACARDVLYVLERTSLFHEPTHAVRAVSVDDGQVLWRHPCLKSPRTPRLAVAHRRVLVMTDDGAVVALGEA